MSDTENSSKRLASLVAGETIQLEMNDIVGVSHQPTGKENMD